MVDEFELWAEFNVAMVGATAALAGLVIVASSVNIGEIIKAKLAHRSPRPPGSPRSCSRSSHPALGLVPDHHGSSGSADPAAGAPPSSRASFQVEATRTIFADRDPAVPREVRQVGVRLHCRSWRTWWRGRRHARTSVRVCTFAAAGCILAIVAGIIVSWVVLVEVLR